MDADVVVDVGAAADTEVVGRGRLFGEGEGEWRRDVESPRVTAVGCDCSLLPYEATGPLSPRLAVAGRGPEPS